MALADAPKLKKEGNALFGKGKYSEAVEKYTQAIDLWMEPHDRAVLYSNRSAARLKLPGERQKALSDATRAVELAPDYAKAHFRRGQALRANGEPEQAAHEMERVLQLEPGDGAAAVALAELREALKGGSGGSGSGGGLGGAFASGNVVPQAAKETQAFSARRPPGIEENFQTAKAHPKGEVLIGEGDFQKVSPAASTFLNRADDAKAAHAALQPPPKPKTRAEIE